MMMMTYETNSELVEWGLRLFDCNQVPNSEYYSGQEQYHSSVENDEVIANMLQADLSESADSQPSGFSRSVEYFPEPDYVGSWYHCPPSHSIYSENDHYDKDMTDVEVGRSSSSLSTEDYSYDEYASPSAIPHVPRVNGEFLTADEASSDYERLRSRLEFCGMSEHKVEGDGNCQFRALSDQLYGSPEHHELVRQQVVTQLRTHRKYYEGYVPTEYSDYLKKTLECGAWGDHVTLQAAADLYGVKIIIVTSFKDTYYVDILPKVQKSKRVLYLSFWAEVHYNSVYPQNQTDTDTSMDLAMTKSPKKKWWDFTSKH